MPSRSFERRYQRLTPAAALERLLEGNRRFASNVASLDSLASLLHREELAEEGQYPFATIIGCSDSRAPAETLFDEGLGDLFVARLAGPVVDSALVASAEFACEAFDTPVIMVLGHSQCGAATATVHQILEPHPPRSADLAALIDAIRPAAEPVIAAQPDAPREHIINETVKANVLTCVAQILARSAIIRERVEDGRLKLVGAIYMLHSGQVELLT